MIWLVNVARILRWLLDILTDISDKPDLHLSYPQRKVFDGWKRPVELLSKYTEDVYTGLAPVMSVPGKTDLVQDMLTDCSVVASLCATTSMLERGQCVVSRLTLSS